MRKPNEYKKKTNLGTELALPDFPSYLVPALDIKRTGASHRSLRSRKSQGQIFSIKPTTDLVLKEISVQHARKAYQYVVETERAFYRK